MTETPDDILTEHRPKPIPTRDFDWEAVRTNYDGGDRVGHGRTEDRAVQNLLDQEAADADPDTEDRHQEIQNVNVQL